MLGQVHLFVIENVVIYAQFAQSVWNTPAPGMLLCGAEPLQWEWEEKRFLKLAKAVIRTGRHPAMGQQPTRIVISKPGMDDYLNLKVYHCILQIC
jgi:hypothetical protein